MSFRLYQAVDVFSSFPVSAVSLEFPSELLRWSPHSSNVLDFDLFRCFCDWRPPECHRTDWTWGLLSGLKIDENRRSLSHVIIANINHFQPVLKAFPTSVQTLAFYQALFEAIILSVDKWKQWSWFLILTHICSGAYLTNSSVASYQELQRHEQRKLMN